MNIEALPDKAQEELKELLKRLEQEPFNAQEATYHGLLFVVAAVRPRLSGRAPALFNRTEKLLFDHGKRRL